MSAAIYEQIVGVFRGMIETMIDAIPRVFAGIVVIVLMLLVAKLAERLLRFLLVKLRFDSLLAQAGIDRTLQRIGIRQSLDLVLPRLAYFLLLLLFAQTGAEVFGLQAISGAIQALFSYLPNVVAALLLMVIGVAVAQFASQTITQAAEENGLEFGRPLGRVLGALIIFVVGVMAISQLRVDTDMIRIVTVCLLAGMGLAFGLSFGLGTRELTRNIIAGFYARKLFQVGDEVEVRGHRGVVQAITPAQTLLADGDTMVAVANVALVEDVVRAKGGGETR